MPVITTRISGTGTDKNGNIRKLTPREAPAIRGPILEATLTVSDAQQEALVAQGEEIKSKVGTVMFDSGASLSCFDIETADDLGLVIIGRGSMSSASHTNHPVPLFAGKLILPTITVNVENGMGANLATQGLIALIGRDILQHGTLFYNGLDGSVSFAI